jgi:7,8-dihydropterin-6-yl-methyl-4-(beta-D-ribofuranosyl)aminobenzene 5'-phosphate synthase
MLGMFLVLMALSATMLLNCKTETPVEEAVAEKVTENPIAPVTIIVTYDNNPYDERLKTAWGFSCLVRFGGKSILFDTGGDSPRLLYNMEQLGIDPKEVDVIVLSHIHGDHVGGLSGFLKENSDVTVYVPESFPQNFKDEVTSSGAKLEEIKEARELLDNVYTTGQLDGGIKEQALVLKTNEGLVVITGCAHPGVVKMVEKAKQSVKSDVLLVMGGFHLGSKSENEIQEIVSSFRELGVLYSGACHCSGDKARQLFQEAYGHNFLRIGVGSIITISGRDVRV